MNIWLALLIVFIVAVVSLVFGIVIGYSTGIQVASKEYAKIARLLNARDDLIKALEQEGLLEK